MSEDPNIDLARRLLAALEAGDEEAVGELIHPAYRGHSITEGSPGPEGVRGSIRWLRETFADRRIIAEDLIASGDRVVARVRFTAVQVGDPHGLPPPGRRVEASHVHIWRVAEGRLAEHWLVQDELTPER
jgi:predicted ester cyclase